MDNAFVPHQVTLVLTVIKVHKRYKLPKPEPKPEYTHLFIDINECVLGTADCQADSTCANVIGGYVCLCNSGYTDQSGVCVPVSTTGSEAETSSTTAPLSDGTTGVFGHAISTTGGGADPQTTASASSTTAGDTAAVSGTTGNTGTTVIVATTEIVIVVGTTGTGTRSQ
jgi:hypothetical protein